MTGLLDWLRRRPRFVAGQMWRYDTRPGEEASRVYILGVERDIIHIAVSGTPFGMLHHAPIAKTALEASGLKLDAATSELPEFEEGYAIWREAFDRGEAGVFSVPVAEIVSFVESTIRPPS